MRRLLLAMLAALAVIATASAAHAQELARCWSQSRPMVATWQRSLDLTREVKSPAKEPPAVASRADARLAAGRLRPAQSRAPVLCVDPRDPGCQVEMPDAPARHAHGPVAAVAARAGELFEGVPPADGAPCADTPYRSGPRDGHAPPYWRPPAA